MLQVIIAVCRHNTFLYKDSVCTNTGLSTVAKLCSKLHEVKALVEGGKVVHLSCPSLAGKVSFTPQKELKNNQHDMGINTKVI